jgi:hypothetical protein
MSADDKADFQNNAAPRLWMNLHFPAVATCAVRISLQWPWMSSELVGVDSLENHLTGFDEKPSKRGRPKDIEDDELRNAYAELAFVLEQKWALVGWPLQQANTLSDIREALNLITGIRSQRLVAFCRETIQESTSTSLRKTRKELIQARDKMRAAYEPFARDEAAQRVLRAISNPNAPSIALDLEDRSEWEEQARIWARAKTSYDALQTDLEQEEAYFAQSELLAFINSRKYAFNPLSFASAMAGLPYISWRQSRDRCAEFEDQPLPGMNYRMFLIVERACAKPFSGAEEVIERIKAYLQQSQGADKEACQMLRDNWYFLRLAIPSAFAIEQDSTGDLPYRIFAEYQKRVENQSKLDMTLARKGRLQDSA